MAKGNKKENSVLTAARAEHLLKTRVRELPPDGLFDSFHALFGRIRSEGFPQAAHNGLIASQLAALVKYTIVYGEYRKKRRRYDMSPYINAVKDLWRSAEREQTYCKDPETVATFLLRFIYANLPFVARPDSIDSDMRRSLSLFVNRAFQHPHKSFDFNTQFQTQYHLSPDHFIRLGQEFYQAFLQRANWTREELESVVPTVLKSSVPQALNMLAVSRRKFIDEYCQVRAKEASQAPYEPNPLLWRPIIAVNEQYYAPYPELVAYAAARGLFFRCGSEWTDFHDAFGYWFEAYVGDLLRTKIQSGELIGANDEKQLGYTGKNADWTVLLGDAGLLLECKSSALFLQGKMLATPYAVSKDLAKNLVGEGKGLFQLYEKLHAIKKSNLPTTLRERYAKITRWYPVVILYDQIQHANAGLVVRNLLNKAMYEAGITDFDYQIWHIEELENFLELVPEADFIPQVKRKWEDPKIFQWDLNSYLHSLFGHDRLKSYILVPEEDSVPYKILKELSD